ncbi:LysR family transcriptional regulator [Sporolactobacillus vineae]|uniref:LysR family transcriptional regulator n=1 Tax=Sporolactobacillus vineae TaxID=444463 RepID=UPI000287BA15|nr:LysR family transcriptional regulator [Sporolactobacillus vineae]
MNLKQLYYFRDLAETENYSLSADRLTITQPTLSHAISLLQSELGVLLFEKQGRNVHLTHYGKCYLTYVRKALDELKKGKAALDTLIDPHSGTIELAFIYTMGAAFVPKMVREFSDKPVYGRIRFSFHQGTTQDVTNKLIDESCDLAVCSYAEGHPEISFTPVYREELVLITSKNHPLAKYDRIDLRQTTDYPYILFNRKSGLYPYIRDTFRSLRLQPKIACIVEEDQAMAGLVSINYGIAIIPKMKMLDTFDVKILKITNKIPARIIYLAYLKHSFMSPAADAFKDFLLKQNHPISLD